MRGIPLPPKKNVVWFTRFIQVFLTANVFCKKKKEVQRYSIWASYCYAFGYAKLYSPLVRLDLNHQNKAYCLIFVSIFSFQVCLFYGFGLYCWSSTLLYEDWTKILCVTPPAYFTQNELMRLHVL